MDGDRVKMALYRWVKRPRRWVYTGESWPFVFNAAVALGGHFAVHTRLFGVVYTLLDTILDTITCTR